MNTLQQAVHDYLNLRRNLGFKLKEPGRVAARLRRLHGAAQCSLHYSGVGSCLGSTTSRCPTCRPGHDDSVPRARTLRDIVARLTGARRFRPQALLPFQPKRAHPYLYSDDEVRRLLHAALEMQYRYERG